MNQSCAFWYLSVIGNPLASYLPQMFDEEVRTGQTPYTNYVEWVNSWLGNSAYYEIRPQDLKASQPGNASATPGREMAAARHGA